MDNTPHSKEKIVKLEDAIDIVQTYLKMLDGEDKKAWWEDDKHNPYEKIAALIHQQMPEYEIDTYFDYRDTDEDLIDDVLSVIKDRVINQTITDFQYEQFWTPEIGHERLYITAIKKEVYK